MTELEAASEQNVAPDAHHLWGRRNTNNYVEDIIRKYAGELAIAHMLTADHKEKADKGEITIATLEDLLGKLRGLLNKYEIWVPLLIPNIPWGLRRLEQP
jgi:hypothetical protein